MRYLMILTVGVCLIVASIPAMAEQAEDEAAVRKATEQFMAAYNKHDVKAILALIDESCDNWPGTWKGRAGLQKRYEETFEQSKDTQVQLLEEIRIVFVTPDVAIHKFYEGYTGEFDTDGKPLPPGKGLRAYVYVKKDGKWLRGAMFWRGVEQ